jgi:hypothetical protein
MRFRVSGLDPRSFVGLHPLPDAELNMRGMRRVEVSEKPGAPCRVSLDDAETGERVILLNYMHQPADSPYHQQGPIFVREGVERAVFENEMPPALRRRPLSLRAFDADHMMIEADLVEGAQASPLIAAFLNNPSVRYIHAHYAKRGCYAALIERA